MINLAPFATLLEHQEYCNAASVPLEEGSVGFKIFKDNEKLGLCNLKFVSDVAYILNLTEIDNKISVQMLANVFTSVIEFIKRVGIQSIVFPIQSENDAFICQTLGFDKISETMYVFDFPQEMEEECTCDDCDHHHGHFMGS